MTREDITTRQAGKIYEALHPTLGFLTRLEERLGELGLPDDEFGERVVAVVVPSGTATNLEDRVVAHCRQRLAGFKVPREVRVVDHLPRSAAGKVRVEVLRASLLQPTGGDP